MYKLLVASIFAAMLASCGGASSPQTTDAGSNALPAAAGEPATTAQSLVYVSEGGINSVAILSYPGFRKLRKITRLHDPTGVCSDAAGDVWVVNSKSTTLDEYAHGAVKPMATLSDSTATAPFACSVDPTTGNLAVTSTSNGSGPGSVLVYSGAQGAPKTYTDANLTVAYFCTYDTSGDLFVDGLNSSYAFVLLELPAGGTKFKSISLSGTIDFPGGVAWDGKQLAIGDDEYDGKRMSAIDHVSISKRVGTIVKTIPLDNSCDVLQFVIIAGKTLAAPDACLNALLLYRYPAGHKVTKRINQLQYPVAAAFSAAP